MARAVPLAVVLAAGLLAACAGPGPGRPVERDGEECVRLFEQYDRVSRRHGAVRMTREGVRAPSADVSRWAQRLVEEGCQTRGRDLDGMESFAATLTDFRIESGPTALSRPVPVHLGVVTSIADEARVTIVFRGLGYNSRGLGALGLGRRIYIGPFTSQEAADQALEVARGAGFIAPYVPAHTRF